MAGCLLAFMLLLNAAAVLPSLHALWHDEHGCDQPDCVVLAVAHGSVDPTTPAASALPPETVGLPLPLLPVVSPVSTEDCPVLPGRAPPV